MSAAALRFRGEPREGGESEIDPIGRRYNAAGDELRRPMIAYRGQQVARRIER